MVFNGVVGIHHDWKKGVIYGVGPLGLLGPGRVELPADASAALSPWLTPPSWHIKSCKLNIIGLKIIIKLVYRSSRSLSCKIIRNTIQQTEPG